MGQETLECLKVSLDILRSAWYDLPSIRKGANLNGSSRYALARFRDIAYSENKNSNIIDMNSTVFV